MSRAKILIADDTPLMQQMLSSHIKELGYKNVFLAKDGKKAVAMVKEEKIDLTFLDIDMPELNGLDALKEIKADNPEAYVIIVSGVSTVDNIQLAIKTGAKGFIVKPFSPQKVMEALDNFEKMVSDKKAKEKQQQSELIEKMIKDN